MAAPIATGYGLGFGLVSVGHEVHVFTSKVDGHGVLIVPSVKKCFGLSVAEVQGIYPPCICLGEGTASTFARTDPGYMVVRFRQAL